VNKWEELKKLMKADISHAVHYSSDKRYEHGVTQRYLDMMEQLEKREKEGGFLFTDVPDFDKKQWEKMLKNLEGLS
jgi:hypothetical protein